MTFESETKYKLLWIVAQSPKIHCFFLNNGQGDSMINCFLGFSNSARQSNSGENDYTDSASPKNNDKV